MPDHLGRRVTITVQDRDFRSKGTIGAPLSVVATPRHNQQPDAEVTIPLSAPCFPDLLVEGARIMIRYDNGHLIGGAVDRYNITGPKGKQPGATFHVVDDFAIVHEILAWPVPTGTVTGSSIGGQTVEQRTITGPAETVAKTVIGENATRLGIPVTIATDLGRGATITVQWRMEPIADQLLEALTGAGVGLTVRQQGSGYLVDCYAPRVFTTPLTVASRAVRSFTVTRARFTASNVVVGGDGAGTARVYRQRVSGRSAVWGRKVEKFVTASGTTAQLDAAGDQALAQYDTSTGLSVELAETETARYSATGDGFRVGDQLSIVIGQGIPAVTGVLTEAPLRWNARDGLRITPTVGDPTNGSQMRRLLATVASIARATRHATTSR